MNALELYDSYESYYDGRKDDFSGHAEELRERTDRRLGDSRKPPEKKRPVSR
jgi:hypothetical protein